MCEKKDVSLWAKMKMTYADIFKFGMAFLNDVWDYEESTYTLQKLRRLPPWSFREEPSIEFLYSSGILPGVVVDKKGVVRYFQDQEDGEKELKSIYTITEPTSTRLGGTPLALPIIPLVNMLKFNWTAQMQKINRVGAPSIFIKVTKPKPAKGSNLSDVDYAKFVLQNWGKNNALQLRENMEVITLDASDNTSALDTIEALNNLIIDYFSPVAFTPKEGSLISNSGDTDFELLQAYIRGVHLWVEDAFEALLEKYLIGNGYEGYTVSIEIPNPSIDKTELQIKKAKALYETQCATLEEIREVMELEELSEEMLKEIQEARAAPQQEFMQKEGKTTRADEKEQEEESDNTESIIEELVTSLEARVDKIAREAL
jgi:hypothetical protein